MRILNMLAVVGIVMTLCCSIQAQESDSGSGKAKTVEVKRKDVKIYKTVEGVVESTSMQEVKTDFDQWSDLEIKSVVRQGESVVSGTQLLAFDTESIDKALTESKLALNGSVLDTKDAELAASEAKKMAELEAEIAENRWKQVQEDHDYYFETQKPENLKSLEFRLKSSQYSVENAQEELDQLKAMYTEDELTEESELIVLKRAERSLESAQRRLELTEMDIKRQKKFDIPRADIGRNNALVTAQLDYEKFKVAAEIKNARTANSVEKAKFQLVQKQRNLEKLQADRRKMEMKSPSAGIVFYGRCVRGKWVGVSGSSSRQLEVGKKVPANKVLMTIVDPGSVMVRAEIDEDMLQQLRADMKGIAKVPARPNSPVAVTIQNVGTVALDSGKYNCELRFDNPIRLMPGSSCKAAFLVHQAKKQLVAPAASVFSDDGIQHYVLLENGNRQDVKVGMKSGSDLEILEGLAEGQKILAKKPE